jgi:hypothetical protein
MANRWVDNESSNASRTAVMNWAEVGLHTHPDGIKICLVQKIDEGLDSNIVAKQVTSNRLKLVGKLLADITTAANDTSIHDDVGQVVDGLSEKTDTEWAEVEVDNWFRLLFLHRTDSEGCGKGNSGKAENKDCFHTNHFIYIKGSQNQATNLILEIA